MKFDINLNGKKYIVEIDNSKVIEEICQRIGERL